MAIFTWTGDSLADPTNWFDADNWDLDDVPGLLDDVIIDGDVTVNIIGGSVEFSSLTVSNGATVINAGFIGNVTLPMTIELQSGAELRLVGGEIHNATVTQNGGTLTSPTNPAPLIAQAQALNNVTLDGDVFAPSTLRLAIDNATTTARSDDVLINATGGVLVLRNLATPYTLSQTIEMTDLALGLDAPVSTNDPRDANFVVAASGMISGSGAIVGEIAAIATGRSDLRNEGTIESRAVGSTQLSIITNSFENAGDIRATEGSTLNIGNGDQPLDADHVFRNLVGGTLTGGFYDVVAGETGTAAIAINGNDPSGNPHALSVLVAQISLSGAGSDILVNGASIAGSLQEIAEGGQLNLFDRDFEAGGEFTVSGFLNLQGSTILGGGESFLSLSLTATGFIGGYGAVEGSIVNNGGILAAGVPGNETLRLGGNVSGTGALEVNGISTLEIGGSVSAGQTVTFSDSVDGSSETLRLLADVAAFDGTIVGFGTGDIIEFEYAEATEAVVRVGEPNLLDVFNGSQLLGTLVFGASLAGEEFSVTPENDVDGQGILITLGAPPFVPTYDGVWQVYGPDNFDYGSLFFGGSPVSTSLDDIGGGRQRFTADYAGDRRVVFEGAGLIVDIGGTPTGGVVDRIEVSNFDTVTNTPLADFFSEPGSGHVMAVPFTQGLVTDGGLDAFVRLLRGDNKFIGSANNDIVQDDFGNNEFDGGDGFDTIYFGPKLISVEVTSGHRPGDPLGIGTAIVIDDFWQDLWKAIEKLNAATQINNVTEYNDHQNPPPPNNNTNNTGGSTGHPHIQTFDGSSIGFQAVGEFVLSRSTVLGETFEVQVRLGPIEGNAPISTTFAMAALVPGAGGDQRVTIDPARANPLRIDGVETALSAGDSIDLGGATLSFNVYGRYLLTYDSGQTVSAQLQFYGVPHLDVVVSVPANRPNGTVEGLSGNDDGNFENDVTTVAGTPAITYDDFYGTDGLADKWRVTDATALFDYEPGDTTETFTDRDFPGSIVTLADFPIEVIEQASALAIAAGLTDPGLRQDAILDYLLTGNIGFIQSAANLQAQGLGGKFIVNPEAPVPPSGVGVAAMPASIDEEAGATTTVTFTIFRIGGLTGAVDVQYAVVAGGVGYADSDDFGGVLPSGTVTIPVGQNSVEVSIELENGFTTATERVRLQITGASNALGAADILAPLAEVAVDNIDPTSGTPAVAEIVTVTAGVGLTVDGSAWVLNLGDLAQGSDLPPVILALANVGPFGANDISGTLADDGDVDGFTFVLPPAIAQLAAGGLKSLSIDPDTAVLGAVSETITFILTEGNGSGYSGPLGTITLTVLADIVEVVNSAPVAGDDAGATSEDVAVQFTAAALLANDDDPDEDTLNLVSVGTPVGGTVSLSGGLVTFTPTLNFGGAASFSYTVSDGDLSDVGTVNVTVSPVNDEQTAPATNTVATNEDTASAAVAIGAADVDGDTLSYAVKSTAQPAKGTVAFNAASGTFVYTPNANANGADGFTILIDDGQGAVSEQVVAVTITPVNDEQTAPATNTVATNEDTASAAVAIGAADVDGDTLSYAVKSTAQPAKGTVAFNAASGTFVYTPNANASGADGFTILIDDGQGAVSEQVVAVTITPVNDVASITGTSTGTVTEDGTLTASGDLDVADPDAGEAAFQTPASLAGTYGTFSFNAGTGAWGYTLDNASAAVQALTAADTRFDVLNVTSLDGTAVQSITVTVRGADEGGSVIVGQPGQTTVNGTVNADSILIGRTNIFVNAGNGDDSIAISPSSGFQWHVLNGGSGSDTLDLSLTSAGATVTLGNGLATSSQIGLVVLASIENVIGSSGGDTIVGSGGVNRIEGGSGNDRSSGGGAADVFVFKPDFGNDRIFDFDANPAGGQDLLELSGFGIDSGNFASRVVIADAGNDVLLTIDGDADQTIRLQSVSNHLSVTIDDFRFI